jgi:hypothetical protein
MQAKMIEETLRRIIEIDTQAVEVEQNAIDNEKEKRRALKKEQKALEFSIMKQARKEAKVKYDAIIEKARLEAAEIEASGQAECERLDKLLEQNKEEMVEKVFIRLFDTVMNQARAQD